MRPKYRYITHSLTNNIKHVEQRFMKNGTITRFINDTSTCGRWVLLNGYHKSWGMGRYIKQLNNENSINSTRQ